MGKIKNDGEETDELTYKSIDAIIESVSSNINQSCDAEVRITCHELSTLRKLDEELYIILTGSKDGHVPGDELVIERNGIKVIVSAV